MADAPLIPSNWQLPDYFRGRLGVSAGRQRLMIGDKHMLIVAHAVPKTGDSSRRGLLFWRNAEGEWKASNGDPGKMAIANLLEVYEQTLEQFETLEAKAQLAAEYLPLLDGLAPFVRSSRNLYEVLQEARSAAPEVKELIDVRDRAYELSRSAELLYQDAKNSMEVAVVRRAEEQAASSERLANASHRLNTLAAIFFPLATLGAVFGTSLTENWSWSRSSGPFVMFVATGILLGLVLVGFVNKRPTAR